MSDLVGNPEDRFSHNEAQIILVFMSVKFPGRFLAYLVSGDSYIHAYRPTIMKMKTLAKEDFFRQKKEVTRGNQV